MISKRPFLTHSLYTLLYYVIILILYVYSLLSFLLEYITKNTYKTESPMPRTVSGT